MKKISGKIFRVAHCQSQVDVLENITGKEIFSIYKKLHTTITSPEFELNPEWNYYNDGKAWLCKVSYRKKTVFWLSVWNTGIKTSFYFTEKTRQGVLELAISDEIKQRFRNATLIGKLIPLSMTILKEEHLSDLRKIIHYKKTLK